ncbi:MAG: DUF11 domain-containing protein [Candidatus Thorarchaeota archaeon]|nr:DUF11 domain-containing protein [Candidatus Thorarchaeota archaeon]
MRIEYKHAFALFLVGFMIMAPAVTAATLDREYISAQQDFQIEDLLNNILENGAELVFANINDQGEPAVIYGQLGIPSGRLALTDEMYDGCIVMALVATYGEMIEYIFDLIGDITSSEGDGGFFPLQDGGFDLNSIFAMIGTEFSLLANMFLDLTPEASLSQMNAIKSHLQSEFGFSFQDLFSIRIDDSLFPPEMVVDLPFSSIDVYLYNVLNADTIGLVFDVMDSTGFASAIDQNVFTNAPAAAAGLIAVPDMDALLGMIEGFTSGPGDFILASDFVLSQFENLSLSGPLALAAVGYIDEQIISNEDTSLDIFGDLLGSIGTVSPLDTGLSLVIANLPYNMNVTSYSPENEAQNLTYHESNETNIIFWNSTGLGVVNDYTINFNADDLPPMVRITREFTPTSVTVGGTVEVTVTISNMGTDPIANVSVSDVGFSTLYPSATVSGDTTGSWLTLAGDASQSITYEVTFANEGRYAFPGAQMVYSFSGNDFTKDTSDVGFEVTADLGGLLYQSILDGMPFTGAIIGLVAIGGIWQIFVLVKGKGGSDFYQM